MIPSWAGELLACPYEGGPLNAGDRDLSCAHGHRFRVVHGVPVLLRDDVAPTHHIWRTTAADIERLAGEPQPPPAPAVDPFVERWIVVTCGRLYRRLSSPLDRYPIPDLDLPRRDGATFLDVGSNWGRWSFAARRLGYRAIALDPSLDAALAGTRIAKQLDLPVSFVVGDARHLPFRAGSFDVVFSYSVLQHLDKAVVRRALAEMARVGRPGRTIRVQMANVLGLRQLMNRAGDQYRRFVNVVRGRPNRPYAFRVRAWTPREIAETFGAELGRVALAADGFFSLDAQMSDLDLLRPFERNVVRASAVLRRLARKLPALTNLADSVMVESPPQRSNNG